MISEFFSVKAPIRRLAGSCISGRSKSRRREEFRLSINFSTGPTRITFCLEIKRKRMGAKRYDKDMRGLLGTSNAQVIGPGSRYQIDATISDVYLVSRLDPSLIIGRPVVYVVIDVFSRLITGIYIGGGAFLGVGDDGLGQHRDGQGGLLRPVRHRHPA